MNKRLLILLYLVLAFNNYTIIAQEEEGTTSLPRILVELQERFGVQFNYASALVDELQVPPPDTTLSLEQTIDHLKTQSNLDFVFVSDSIISIKKKRLMLCGYLLDVQSNEALPYVTVKNGTRGTITNPEGYFEIEAAHATDVIQIRHIGHKTIQREAQFFNTAKCARIYLIPEHEQLEEVILYQYLIRGVDKLGNGSLQIDFNKFSILPGLIEEDVLQSVQALPGIQSIDETVSNINIRGGSNDQNLITWDGIKMYQSGHFFGLISMYNPHMTQKVELHKNGSGVSETDGVSGTIAMKTKDYINPEINGSIGVNLIDANGFVDAPLGQKASIQISARKAISNFIETPTYTKYFDRIAQDTEIEKNTATEKNSDIGFDFHDASFRLLFHPSDKDRLRVNFIYTANEVSFNENALVSGEVKERQSTLNQLSIAGGIQYQRDWTETLDSELMVYETDYQLKAVNANILDNQRFLQKNKVSETGVKLKVGKKITPHLKWTNGYQLMETKVTNLDDVDDPEFKLLEAEVLRAHGIFSEIGFLSDDKATRLNLGMRFNHLDKFKKQIWEPRLSFNHGFGKGFTVEVLGEFKHQNTSQVINFQNDFLGVEKRRWQLSDNDSIPVITSKQISTGLSYNKNGWLANAVAFYKKVNGITTQSQSFQDRYEYVKTAGNYDAKGIDVLLRKQLKNASYWLSYATLKSDYHFKDLPETNFPSNFDITHAVTLGTNYTLNRFLVAAGLNWRTGKPYTRPVVANEVNDDAVNFGSANSSRHDDYLRLDVSAKYEFKWGKNTKTQIGVAAWNVLNRDNTINTFYRPETATNAKEYRQSSLGFTPNASIRLIFN